MPIHFPRIFAILRLLELAILTYIEYDLLIYITLL